MHQPKQQVRLLLFSLQRLVFNGMQAGILWCASCLEPSANSQARWNCNISSLRAICVAEEDGKQQQEHAHTGSKQPAGRGTGERGLPGSSNMLTGDPALQNSSSTGQLAAAGISADRVLKVGSRQQAGLFTQCQGR